MSYIINLLEALIVSYGLVELCNIDKKKIFFVLNTVITFLMINYFDCINQNFTVSMLIFGLLWYVLVCVFAQENYIYNLFIAIFINLLCDLSAVIPVLFIYKYSVVFAGLTAKLIQFIMTYLFVKFRRKYYYFEDKYWFTIITVMVLGELIIIFQDEQIISNVYTTTNVLINIFIVIIMGISL